MKKFLAIFTCSENSKNHQTWMKLDKKAQEDRLQKGMAAKTHWDEKYKAQIVFEGSPLGDKTKKVDMQGIHDISSLMGAYLVVQANSHDEAAKMFLEHPHFAIFPGDGVDVIECAQREID